MQATRIIPIRQDGSWEGYNKHGEAVQQCALHCISTVFEKRVYATYQYTRLGCTISAVTRGVGVDCEEDDNADHNSTQSGGHYEVSVSIRTIGRASESRTQSFV